MSKSSFSHFILYVVARLEFSGLLLFKRSLPQRVRSGLLHHARSESWSSPAVCNDWTISASYRMRGFDNGSHSQCKSWALSIPCRVQDLEITGPPTIMQDLGNIGFRRYARCEYLNDMHYLLEAEPHAQTITYNVHRGYTLVLRRSALI